MGAFVQDMWLGMGVLESEARAVSGEVRFIMLALLVHTLSQLANHGGTKIIIHHIHSQALAENILK